MFNPALPLGQAVTLPASAYFDRTGDAFLAATWQYIAPVHLVQNPGDYVTCTITGDPLLFVNDQGRVHGLHNVCRHHAATILTGCGSACTRLRCPYHGWTYDLSGRLRGTPEFDDTEFDREANSLPAVQTDTYGPFLFARIQPGPPLREALKAVAESNTVPQDYRFVARRTYRLKCNWKVFVDNYLDGGYHVNSIHGTLASVLDYKQYATHLHDGAVVQVAPTKPSADATLNETRAADTAYYWWVFPNFMINVYGKMMDVNAVYPLTPTTCEVVIDFFRAPDLDDSGFIDASIAQTETIQQEDVEICERVQEGMGSSSFTHGRYSARREGGMYYFHQLISR